MPFSIPITFRAESDIRQEDLSLMHNHLRGVLLRWVRDGNYPSPRIISGKSYTVSPLVLDKTARNVVSCRITLLDDNDYSSVMYALSDPSQRLRLKRIFLDLENVSIDLHQTYEELAISEESRSTIILKSLTPVYFRSPKMSNLLPSPDLVFNNLLRKWNDSAPRSLLMDESISELIAQKVTILRANNVVGQHEAIFPRYKLNLIGFAGRVMYGVDACPSGLRKLLSTLAEFANYSGIGENTFQGFGQVKRLRKWMSSRFFISYSSKDAHPCSRIAGALQKAGFETWLDQKDILIGQPILDRVSQGIESESEYVIILISRNSISSEWCKLELRMAYQKELMLRRIAVLPIVIDAVTIPPEVRTKKYFSLDVENDSSMKEFIEQVSELVWLQDTDNPIS